MGYLPPSDEPVKDRIQLTAKTDVYVTGHYSDLIDILSNDALVVRDYVREDSNFSRDDIRGNDTVIAVRAGRNNDLAVIYGLVYQDGIATAVDVYRFYIRDGNNINITVDDNEVKIEYGNRKDLRTRFAYIAGQGWLRSPGNNRNGTGYPLATDPIPSERLPS